MNDVNIVPLGLLLNFARDCCFKLKKNIYLATSKKGTQVDLPEKQKKTTIKCL